MGARITFSLVISDRKSFLDSRSDGRIFSPFALAEGAVIELGCRARMYGERPCVRGFVGACCTTVVHRRMMILSSVCLVE